MPVLQPIDKMDFILLMDELLLMKKLIWRNSLIFNMLHY